MLILTIAATTTAIALVGHVIRTEHNRAAHTRHRLRLVTAQPTGCLSLPRTEREWDSLNWRG